MPREPSTGDTGSPARYSVRDFVPAGSTGGALPSMANGMSSEPMMDTDGYPAPLEALLTRGGSGIGGRAWAEYLAMGFTHEHVPALLRMADDPELHGAPSDDPRVYAPLHAWRVLGLLRAREAAAPLAGMMVRYEFDLAREDLPRVLGMIGEAAVEPVRAVLENPAAALFTRAAAASALQEVAERHPGERGRVVALLTEQLRGWPEQDAMLNAFLIDALVELGATDAAPLIRAAFEADAVDDFVRGDWEDVQIELGLLEDRLTPPPPPWWSGVGARDPSAAPAAPAAQRPSAAGKTARKAKDRRKAAKQARKRNRGR
jgi:hypothetical protein